MITKTILNLKSVCLEFTLHFTTFSRLLAAYCRVSQTPGQVFPNKTSLYFKCCWIIELSLCSLPDRVATGLESSGKNIRIFMTSDTSVIRFPHLNYQSFHSHKSVDIVYSKCACFHILVFCIVLLYHHLYCTCCTFLLSYWHLCMFVGFCSMKGALQMKCTYLLMRIYVQEKNLVILLQFCIWGEGISRNG